MSKDLFIAGSPFEGDVPHAVMARIEAVSRSAACFAWLGDGVPSDPRFWLATKHGKRTFLAEPGTKSLGKGLCRPTAAHLYECGDRSSAMALTSLIVEHDPNEVHVGALYCERLLRQVSACASHIEKRLLLHLAPDVADNTLSEITVQKTVLGGKYRLDLAIENEGYRSVFKDEVPPVRIAVEADGHEFHERTREQATRDKARDRALTADGWRVLRFSGSEIWKAPEKCAREVVTIVNSIEQPEEPT